MNSRKPRPHTASRTHITYHYLKEVKGVETSREKKVKEVTRLYLFKVVFCYMPLLTHVFARASEAEIAEW